MIIKDLPTEEEYPIESVLQLKTLCICGAPGIGRTQYLSALANELSQNCNVIIVAFGSYTNDALDQFKQDSKHDEELYSYEILELTYAKNLDKLLDQLCQKLETTASPKTLIIDDLSLYQLWVEDLYDETVVDVLDSIMTLSNKEEYTLIYSVPIRFSRVKKEQILPRHWLFLDGGMGIAERSDMVLFLDRGSYYDGEIGSTSLDLHIVKTP